MRTIKFKGKRLDNQEWTCGFFYKENGNTYIIEDRQKESMLNRNFPYKVVSDTVCQFTGFTDKNGKEVYEGDVLRSDIYPFSCTETHEYDNYYGAISWSEKAASFYIAAIKTPKLSVRDICNSISQEIIQDFEVVGNIHDPEWKQYGEYIQEEDKEESDD